jgi:predicted Fe-Mo cluster-binding NifX family protein
MKIAAVTDDGKTLSAHFGRAKYFAIYTVEDGTVLSSELVEKEGHHTFSGGHGEGACHQGGGHGHGAGARHRRIMKGIEGCSALLARGMGRGAYLGLQERGIRPVLTDIHDAEKAVRALIDGTIEERPERLHG